MSAQAGRTKHTTGTPKAAAAPPALHTARQNMQAKGLRTARNHTQCGGRKAKDS